MNLIPQVFAQAETKSITVNKPTGFYTSFETMISQVLNIALIVGVIIVLFYLIWGGIDWMTSGGDKGKTESARNKITAAIIGLIILVSSWAIMMFVQQILGLSIFQ